MNELGWPETSALPESMASPPTELSLERLVQEHTDFTWRLLRRLGLSPSDADDATQQVFMVAAKHLDRIDSTSARAFLYGTALRVAQNARRGQKRRRALLEAQGVNEPRSFPGPDARLELREACELLDRLLDALPDEQRRVFVLVEVEQLGLLEVAELEGIARGTVASRLRLARERLASLVEHEPSRNPFGGGND